jgi:hypothetical protein
MMLQTLDRPGELSVALSDITMKRIHVFLELTCNYGIGGYEMGDAFVLEECSIACILHPLPTTASFPTPFSGRNQLHSKMVKTGINPHSQAGPLLPSLLIKAWVSRQRVDAVSLGV